MPPNGGLLPPNHRRRFPLNIFRRRPRGPPEDPADAIPAEGRARHGIHHAMMRLRRYRDTVRDFLNRDRDFENGDQREPTLAQQMFRENRVWAINEISPPHVLESALGSTPDTESDTCVICLESLQEGEMVRTMLCRHVFHQSCIDPWIEGNSNCPVCRRMFYAVWEGGAVR